MDTPIWVTVAVGLGAAGIGGVCAFVAGVRSASITAAATEGGSRVAEQVRQDARERWLVERVEKAWDLCRSSDRRARRAGVRMLRPLIQEPGMPRLVAKILDEVVQEELGQQLSLLRAAWVQDGKLPDVDIVVIEDDDEPNEEVEDH